MQCSPYFPNSWLVGWIDWFIQGLKSSSCQHLTLSYISNVNDLEINMIWTSWFFVLDVVEVVWAHHQEAVS